MIDIKWIIAGVAIPVLALVIRYGLPWLQYFGDRKANKEAKKTIKALLSSDKWTMRSFAVIKRRLGGLEDDKIRKLLRECGAISFDGVNEEVWGLRDRVEDVDQTPKIEF